jgi:hypothetical protein
MTVFNFLPSHSEKTNRLPEHTLVVEFVLERFGILVSERFGTDKKKIGRLIQLREAVLNQFRNLNKV